jgi:hypothetical protein
MLFSFIQALWEQELKQAGVKTISLGKITAGIEPTS